MNRIEGGVVHIAEATDREKGSWGWLILGLPPFVWAIITIALFVTAISVNTHSGSVTAFSFGMFFSLVFFVSLSKHHDGRLFPMF